METNYRKQELRKDPAAFALVDYFERRAVEIGFERAQIYSHFPLYREEDDVVSADLLVISPNHGVIIFCPVSATELTVVDKLEVAVERAERAFSLIFSRLVKSKILQKSRTTLKLQILVAAYLPDVDAPDIREVEGIEILRTEGSLEAFIERVRGEPLSSAVFGEACSIIEGAKGLLKPRERNLKDFRATSKVALVASLEAEIRRFDRDQKQGYLAPLNGPQRIRGLAGSGKTVVLAMKAALVHLKDPAAHIAYTFYTKSLYQHVKRLITRFYRQFDDRDPDWEKLHILHAWGGSINPGIYYNAARASGVRALTYGEASVKSSKPFDFACLELLSSGAVKEMYDYFFLDECQDFEPSFMRLSLALTRKGRVVLAYDELQTIFHAKTPTAATIFGSNEEGGPLATFEEDVVLHKCYRNALEVLVCAHAIGLGLYGDRIVQLPENEQHWEDLGYRVEQGALSEGQDVVILRLPENSPSSISTSVEKNEIVIANAFAKLDQEIAWVSQQIISDIRTQGLSPDDILVISADDRNSKIYFREIGGALRAAGIEVNDLQSDSFSIRDFSEAGKVTFSTVYKAKGNEGFVVFIVGVDAIFDVRTIRNRNIAFTAMTRAKGWLRVSGMGPSAQAFCGEIAKALENCPRLRFRYPGPNELSVMQRDVVHDRLREVERSLADLEESVTRDELESFLRRRLDELGRVGASSRKRTSKRPGK